VLLATLKVTPLANGRIILPPDSAAILKLHP